MNISGMNIGMSEMVWAVAMLTRSLCVIDPHAAGGDRMRGGLGRLALSDGISMCQRPEAKSEGFIYGSVVNVPKLARVLDASKILPARLSSCMLMRGAFK